MEKNKIDKNLAVLLSLFAVSLSLFNYQIILTRLYSAVLSYHYVFLTTSFAVLGLGIGSILAYPAGLGKKNTLPKDSQDTENVTNHVSKWSFILSCGFVTIFTLIYFQPFVDNLFVFITLGIVPFVISGYLYALLFKSLSFMSAKLYFFDLMGAGVASVAVVLLLNNLGMFKSAVVICLLPLIVTFILPRINKPLTFAKFAIAAVLAVGLFLPAQTANSIQTNFQALLRADNKTFATMHRQGLSPEIVYSRWDSFARTDVIRTDVFPQVKFITIDGAANAPMYEFDGNIESLYVFDTNTGFIPFLIGENESALIIGAGGGRGVLYALAAGSNDIAAVEINVATIDAVRMFGDFNGHIFDRPEVRVYTQDGRNFVRTSGEKFDVVFLSLVVTSTSQNVGFALSENYIHTVEAVEDYLDILNYNGKVVFVTHDLVSLQRLTTTAIQALVNRGIPLEDTPNHFAIFYEIGAVAADGASAQVIAPVIMIKNEPFTVAESEALLGEIRRIGATPEYVPHLHELGLVAQIKNNLMSFEQFVESSEQRVSPVTDNSPYFFHFERNIPTVLIQILAFGFVGSLLLLIPCFRKKGNFTPSIYFGLLGMGYMMVQIPLIQKFILYLGHPTPAFSYTLASMLIGSGIGGYFSSRKLFKKTVNVVYFPPILAAVLIFIVVLSMNPIFQITSGFGNVGKIAVAAVIAAVPGFFMGMPFPRGLTLLGESDKKDIIPLMWGINGTMSVAGSVVSIILSMTFGFTAALMAGAVIYVVVGFVNLQKTS